MYDTNEIYHHGILGQKWGKKNGPPYPLGSEDHSVSEKKAGWRKSLSKDSSNEDSSGFHFTDKQKKYIKIGVGVTATLLASYGAYKLGSMDKLGNVGLKGAAFVDRIIGKNKGAGDFLNSIDDLAIASGFNKNKSILSITDATKKVNPNYLTGKPEYRNNCFSSVAADLLNRANNGQGLDVIARPANASELSRGGMSFNQLLDNWQGSSIDDIIVPKANIGSAKSSLAKSIIDKCDGKDSFGIIRIKSQQNSAKGHYIKWEIKDGECIFSDSLSGTVGADNYFNAIGSAVSRSIEFARVDGLAVNPFSIKDIVQNRI